MERTHTITLTDEEWAGVTLAFVSRLQELEREEPGMRERSPDEQAVIDWYRKLFQKIHGVPETIRRITMQCDPYEKRSVRSKRNWGEAAAHLGVHPAILREAYISRYFGPIQAKDFISIIMRKGDKDDKKFVTMVKETCAAIKWTEAEIAEKEEKTQEAMEDSDFADLMNYRLKLLIEIGDEWLSDETKTYTFSDTQYLIKGKRYTIQTLRDEGGSEFGLTTTTDLPKETNYTSVHACKSIWRDGKEIWNWHRAYLALWLEQNPDHPQTQEMIDHCNGKADLVLGCT